MWPPGRASARATTRVLARASAVRTRFANRVLRQALVESARGAVLKRDSYLAAQYRRLVKRRGDKKAIVAVAHSLLVIAYHVLRDGVSYRELGRRLL
jgi:transposase